MRETGFGPTHAAMLLTLFSCVCGLLCGLALIADVPERLLLGAYVVLCVWWYWMTTKRERALVFFRWLEELRMLRLPRAL